MRKQQILHSIQETFLASWVGETYQLCIFIYFYRQSVLKKTATQPNHTSYRKFDFNEFVRNPLCCNMVMIIFDLQGYGGCQRPKTLYLGAHFGSLIQCSVHPTVPVLLTKDSPRNEITYIFQPPFSLYTSNSRTKPTGLDFY